MPLQPLRTILAASAPGAAGRRRPEPRCAACDDLRIVGAACDLETHAVSSPPCAACAADYRPCGHHELDHPAVHACCDCLDGGVVQQRVEGEVVLAGCPAGLRGRHQFRRWARLDLALAGWTLDRWGQTGGADAWAARAARAWVAQLRAADRRPCSASRAPWARIRRSGRTRRTWRTWSGPSAPCRCWCWTTWVAGATRRSRWSGSST